MLTTDLGPWLGYDAECAPFIVLVSGGVARRGERWRYKAVDGSLCHMLQSPVHQCERDGDISEV